MGGREDDAVHSDTTASASALNPSNFVNMEIFDREAKLEIFDRKVIPEAITKIETKQPVQDSSLTTIAKRVADFLSEASCSDREVTVKNAAKHLGHDNRRLYDVINLLEGAGLIERKGAKIRWITAAEFSQNSMQCKFHMI